MTGHSGSNTPPRVNFPMLGSTRHTVGNGKSGNFFEGDLSRSLVQAYFEPSSRPGERQSGLLYGCTDLSGNGWIVDRNWMVARLQLDFGSGRRPAFPPNTTNWARARVGTQKTSMLAVRLGGGELYDFPIGYDCTRYFTTMNSLRPHRNW